jgi:poly(hydroxyalkanoate) depolymerase family esterase
MNMDNMQEALRLTKAGKLKDALSVIRNALPGAHKPAPRPAATRPAAAPMPPPIAMPAGIAELVGSFMDRIEPHMPAHAPAPLHDGSFEEHEFSCPAGKRSYKLFVPPGYKGQKLPLVVMLHGCTQSPDDFAAGTRMNELGAEQNFLVAYPAQSRRANISKCWNWFNQADQHRDAGEPALIAGITKQIMEHYEVEPGAVCIAGLSAGGAAAAVMGAAYPELYAAIGVHSGLACGAAQNLGAAAAAMRSGAAANPPPNPTLVPTIVFHGDADSTVSPINAEQILSQAAAGTPLTRTTTKAQTPDGAAYTRTLFKDPEGDTMLEAWILHGAGHAWSGGSKAGSYTDPHGPDASAEMVRFFKEHERKKKFFF